MDMFAKMLGVEPEQLLAMGEAIATIPPMLQQISDAVKLQNRYSAAIYETVTGKSAAEFEDAVEDAALLHLFMDSGPAIAIPPPDEDLEDLPF